ncbi:MAG TPA: hypothetical protein ENI11_04325 [Actinobacteria bacterium]|nr:hypothetical protein [Actinomycetota bacterium]
MKMKSTFAKIVPDPQKAVTMGTMGRALMIMGIALIAVFFVATLVLASWNSQYWAFDKQTRESAKVGDTVSNSLAKDVAPVETWRSIEVLRSWASGTQFLGMGLLLFGIGIQLASILGILAAQAKFMTEELGPDIKLAQEHKKSA